MRYKSKTEKFACLILFGLMLLSSISFLSAENFTEEGFSNFSSENLSSDLVVLDFFWMSGCPACGQMKEYLGNLQKEYVFVLNSYETSKYPSLFSQKLKEYDVPLDRRGYVPTIFIRDQYFVGYSAQAKEAIELILQGYEGEHNEIPLGDSITTKVLGFWKVSVSLSEKSIFGAGFILALLDSINVCSITVLVFLIVFSLSIGSVRRAFKIGLVFTTVIFLFYILFMLLLTGIIGSLIVQYGNYVRGFVVLISLFAGLLLIKDFFWYGKGISLSIPEFSKPFLEKYIKQATIGSTILLGVLASLVELPCTAVFPLIYTTLLAEAGIGGLQKVLYILFYNLVYIWPLLFIVFGTYFSWTRIEDVDEEIQKYKGVMRLVAGIALLLIALYFAWPFLVN